MEKESIDNDAFSRTKMNAIFDYTFKYESDTYKTARSSIIDFETKVNKNLGDEFMEILKNGTVSTVFQPIISLKDGKLLGYEALSRGPKETFFENPERMFEFARIYGRLWDLEFLCRIKALENVTNSKSDFYIFLNVDPNTINDEKFKKGFTKDFLRSFDINPENIVFEITENNTVSDFKSFNLTIDNYKDQGYKIAIDDAGSGYSGLKLITEIHPHYLKLDMTLIRDIDKDGIKHSLIKTFRDFCQTADIKIIAEGIETENELNALIDIGIDYGQGYLIQKPNAQFENIDKGLVLHIKQRNNKKREIYTIKASTALVGDICRKSTTVDPFTSGANVLELFNKNNSIQGLPIVEHNRMAGLVMRDKFFSKLGTQYGFALYVNRPISLLMDKRPLVVDYDTTIDIVSKLATTRSEEKLYDYIVVTKDEKYYGIVTVKDLLEKTTELEINYARHLNPLTGLPGNLMIEQRLTDIIFKGAPYTVLYIDIDNFKPYNDVYGFENGDRIIQYLCRVISQGVEKYCVNKGFVGHIGGDDFIIIVEGYEVEEICMKIIHNFEAGLSGFYNEEDANRKYIVTKNRYGIEESFLLVSLSISGVSNKTKEYKDIYELSEHAVMVKKKCKCKAESCYIVE